MLATLTNISFQFISLQIYVGDYSLFIAIFNGTLGGLLLKYILDKKFIFMDSSKTKSEDTRKFILYSLMGVITTLLFWIVEFTFDAMMDAEYGKYLGAIIGLAIGYVVKYNLDKKYVFNTKKEEDV